MRLMRKALLVALLGWIGCCAALVAQQPSAAPRPVPTGLWAPKPVKAPGYTPPQKPWVKLADLKSKHKGEANWHELLVDEQPGAFFGCQRGSHGLKIAGLTLLS